MPRVVRSTASVVAVVAVLATLAAGCAPEEPGITVEEATRLIEANFPESEVSVTAARIEEEQAVVEALFDGATVAFYFDPAGEEGGEDWVLVEVMHDGSRFAVADLEQISETMVHMNQLAAALTLFQRNTGSFPAGEDAGALDVLVPDYMPEGTAFSDAWEESYRYTSEGESYTLISLGPDGESGTRDDIVLHTGEFVSGASGS